MLKNIPLLFILLIIIAFSLTQEESVCEESPVESRNDCFAKYTPNGYCCFNSAEKKCMPILKTNFKESSKEFDCGITEENYGKYEFGQYHPNQKLEGLDFETCGKNEPKKKQDCTDYSEISNSCCLFTNGDIKSCFHIGRKYIGDFKKNTFKFDGKDYTVECKSFIIILNLYSILLITLLL